MTQNALKILHVSLREQQGGAAKAAHRLHIGQNQNGLQSSMFVQYKDSQDANVYRPTSRRDRFWLLFTGYYETLILRRYPNRQVTASWSINRFPTPAAKYLQELNPDIVHLHWVYSGMLPIKAFSKINKPIVWSLHDMWAITGGCHYSSGCTKYIQNCGNCPLLKSNRENDLSRKTLQEKKKHWSKLNFHIVASSRWLATCTQSSSVLKNKPIQIIPNGLDLDLFRPYDAGLARDVFGLPKEKRLILFGGVAGAGDPRKGFQYARQAIDYLTARNLEDVELVLAGHQTGDEQYLDLPFKTHHVRFVDDDRLLALLYSAVDVLVSPSVEDNLSNMVMEALACGTPCIAFNIGGMPDMINHQDNGFLATPFDVEHFAEGIRWVISDQDNWRRLSENARQTATQNFDIRHIAQRFRELYEEILDEAKYRE